MQQHIGNAEQMRHRFFFHAVDCPLQGRITRYVEMPFAVSHYGRPVARKGAYIMAKIVKRTSDEIKDMRTRGEIMTDKERVSNFSEEAVERTEYQRM